MSTKFVRVTGGYLDNEGVFIKKREEVVDNDKLAILFRRDWELCSLPVIYVVDTNQRPTFLM